VKRFISELSTPSPDREALFDGMRSVVALYLNREVREKEDATTTGGFSAICG
jgi:hypothetical protein